MSEPFLGAITIFAGTFAPRGYAFCQGQILNISSNTALYSLLGTTYGGNGTSSFALPNLMGRVPVSQGQGTGLGPYVLGQVGGASTVSLLTNQMPPHSHTFPASATEGRISTPTAASIYGESGRGSQPPYAGSSSATFASPSSIAGGSQPHNNMMPYLALNFIIALQGVYPSRN